MSLYDDRTYENLMDEAMESFRDKNSELPENQRVDGSVGSFIYMSLAKHANRMEEAYADLDEMNDNMLVDTMDEEHLIDSGVESGVPIKEGTEAEVIADLNCQCEIGDEFSAIDSDYDYIAIELLEILDNEDGSKTYRYLMQADEEGVEPGSYRGDIEPEDYLEGFEEGRIINVRTPGTEQEDAEEYRERRLSSYTSKACAGNREYYIDTIGSLSGVGGVKVERRKFGQSVIPCHIQAADFGVPTQALLAEVKQTMDPDGLEGEGMGLCPIGHVLDIHGVLGVTIDVQARFTFDAGYTFAMLKTAMTEAAKEYISSLAETWQDSTMIVVRRSMVEAKLISIPGILDISDLTLNGEEENVTTSEYEVPVLGEITENVEPGQSGSGSTGSGSSGTESDSSGTGGADTGSGSSGAGGTDSGSGGSEHGSGTTDSSESDEGGPDDTDDSDELDDSEGGGTDG